MKKPYTDTIYYLHLGYTGWSLSVCEVDPTGDYGWVLEFKSPNWDVEYSTLVLL
jgi:hypothetical protein